MEANEIAGGLQFKKYSNSNEQEFKNRTVRNRR
jgi:hypothetical protein